MTEIFDLDAVAREADEQPFRFTFGGETYELPASPDLRVAEHFTNGSILDAFRLLFGADQWANVEASGAKFDMRVALALLDRYGDHLGIDMGNSPASPTSSASTARPSKRTSSGTTKSR